MRYDELSLPLGESELLLRFHERFTVLAGLSGAQRSHLIDAVAQLDHGALRGGSVTLVDSGGRRQVIDETTATDAASLPQRNAGAWRSLIAVGAEELGLPRASDDPGRLSMRGELAAARQQAAQTRQELTAARDERRRHAAALAELADCENRLAELGTASDRHQHRRARALVEIEQVRAALQAVDAPPAHIARDDRLVATTSQIQELAEEWSDVGERLDRLTGILAGRQRPDPSELAALVDIPDEIPEPLMATIAERDRLRAQRSELKAALSKALDTPSAMPSDARVFTLAALDQETLWLTHRDVKLATEALQAAQRTEAERMLTDPTERARVEQAHAAAEAARAAAERRWLPSVLAATISACIAAMLLVTDLWVAVIPALLIVCVAGLVVGVAIPRLRLHRARQHETNVLGQVGADDIADYQARFNENPESERWQRAERVIEDYQVATTEWHELVGDISPADAAALEDTVHAWVAKTDRTRRDRETAQIRREADQISADLKATSERLALMLAPFGVDPRSDNLVAVLQDRVLAGRTARLQIELGDTEEAEAKIRRRLEAELAALGFEAGSLSTRISSYGRELDAARQRSRLRADTSEKADLVARLEALERQLSVPEPNPDDAPVVAPEALDPVVVELRTRRDRLAAQTPTFTDPDTGELKRRLNRIESRIVGLEGTLGTERGLVVANPVDHLVETLVRYRPVWPTTEQEPAPAFLDDPFAATGSELKRQLLDAVVEVARVVQVILLTDDREQVEWARSAERRGLLTLIEPAPRRRT